MRAIRKTSPLDPTSWENYPVLVRAWDAIDHFCSQLGFDDDDLASADWQRFHGEVEPLWFALDVPISQDMLRAHYECYHVFIGRHAYFFWARSDLEKPVFLELGDYTWKEDAGERRNGRVLVARGRGGRMLSQPMTGTRSDDLVGSLASAYAYLQLEPLADRIEVHRDRFLVGDPYSEKPLAVVTRDDLL
jgi:hypothetical protein